MRNQRLDYCNKGTTIIEAMVAVLILSLGLIPVLSSILMASNLSSRITNNLVAANLAQEGVEIVRAIRDGNWLASESFDRFLADCGQATCEGRVEWNTEGYPMTVDDNPTLMIDANGLYNYTTGSATPFSRKVSITKIDPTGCNCEIKVVSEVSWLEKNTLKSVQVESHLYNWRE